jgi:hypothetical protein
MESGKCTVQLDMFEKKMPIALKTLMLESRTIKKE